MSITRVTFDDSHRCWQAQVPIKPALRPLTGERTKSGKPRSVYQKRFYDAPRNPLEQSRREASKLAAAWIEEHEGLLAFLDGLTAEKKAELISLGGFALVKSFNSDWCRKELQSITRLPRSQFPATLILDARETLDHLDTFANPVALVAKPSKDSTWQSLFKLWAEKSGARDTSRHALVRDLLAERFPDFDYTHFTPHDADVWLKWLDKEKGVPKGRQHKYRIIASAMFSCAVPLKMPVHPFRGVKVDGKKPKRKKVYVYTGADIRHVLTTAAATEFGGKRHKAVLWLLRLYTFQGCRANEAAQLQCGDVVKESGAWAVHFRDTCAVTGEKHPQKWIKTEKGEDASRRVPLHPALWDSSHPLYVGEDFREFVKGAPGDFVFACFRYVGREEGGKGRAQYVINEMGRFVRDVCKIDKPNLAPLHSFRHRMNDALINAGWKHDDERERFLGHGGGVNRGYGNGEGLRSAAERLQNVNPLADDDADDIDKAA